MRKSASYTRKRTTTMASRFFPGKMVLNVRLELKGDLAYRDAVFTTGKLKRPSFTPHLRNSKGGNKYAQKISMKKVFFRPFI